MGERRVVDLSRFLLFEAGGDSEADLDANMVSFGLVDDQGNAYMGNDDAESCSNDVGYCPSSHTIDAQVETLEKNDDADGDDDDGMREEEGNVIHGTDHNHHQHGHDDDDMREEGEEENEGMVSEVASTANSYACSRKCGGRSSAKRMKMSEIEKSRLFWEACLAS